MNEAQQPQEEFEDKQPVPLTQALGFGAGTFLAAGMVDLLAHLGPTGLVVGGIVAYAASRHGPDLLEQVRGALPARPSPSRQEGAPHTLASESGGKRSFLDRALGRFPAQEETVLEDADTLIVDEPEETPVEANRQSKRPATYVTHPIRLASDLV